MENVDKVAFGVGVLRSLRYTLFLVLALAVHSPLGSFGFTGCPTCSPTLSLTASRVFPTPLSCGAECVARGSLPLESTSHSGCFLACLFEFRMDTLDARQ